MKRKYLFLIICLCFVNVNALKENINVKEKVFFSRCIDGDTAAFTIKGMTKIVRFLAIDTMEINGDNAKARKYAKEAREYTCNRIKSAKEIILEYDANSDKEDKYNRVLAFVFVDGKLLQKELIGNGLAKIEYVYGNYKYLEELKEEEKLARGKKVGIWSDTSIVDMIEDKYNDINKIIKTIKKIYQYLKKLFTLVSN